MFGVGRGVFSRDGFDDFVGVAFSVHEVKDFGHFLAEFGVFFVDFRVPLVLFLA